MVTARDSTRAASAARRWHLEARTMAQLSMDAAMPWPPRWPPTWPIRTPRRSPRSNRDEYRRAHNEGRRNPMWIAITPW